MCNEYTEWSFRKDEYFKGGDGKSEREKKLSIKEHFEDWYTLGEDDLQETLLRDLCQSVRVCRRGLLEINVVINFTFFLSSFL